MQFPVFTSAVLVVLAAIALLVSGISRIIQGISKKASGSSMLSSIAEGDLTSGPSNRLLKNEMCRRRIDVTGYYAMSLVLGIVYPIHVCLQMRFYMLHFFATVLEKHYCLYCT